MPSGIGVWWAATEIAPALSPAKVMREGSPPKAPAASRTRTTTLDVVPKGRPVLHRGLARSGSARPAFVCLTLIAACSPADPVVRFVTAQPRLPSVAARRNVEADPVKLDVAADDDPRTRYRRSRRATPRPGSADGLGPMCTIPQPAIAAPL